MRKNYAILIVLSVIFILPLLITITNSFMSEAEIWLNYTTKLSTFDLVGGITQKFVKFVLIPASVTLSQYIAVLFEQPTFIVLLMNSIKITLPVVLGNTAVSLLCAYAFTIWKWKHKEKFFFVYIIVMLMPLQAVLVPNYIIADWMNIKTSYLAIILPGIFSPFGVFLLRQSMKAIPKEYFEAAKIDGASDWYIFLHIVLPQMKSGIAALSMLVFIEYWNLVEQVIVFIKDYYKEPLSVFLSRIADGQIGLIFAASCVFMFLPLWFLAMGQRNLEKGIELSGVK
ncbi:Lactose transport system permease protein LacG [Sporotomaculum syntrophicum]|uniref:Lactose transport system permease protein LacG n=1 Tax=Sporotomaculum syntrophicum TaxID=182264 RepID=A0A9D2WQ78_9FIRM|nr:carbohydrate ABC transporter permease [Sporotomaculum syntrophicum]KAF1084921.1 Lactose transport system permease protein LacG [Sporotomaculum syntrophicum]